MSNAIVILAGGSGVRFSSELPKQYTMINGRELLSYSILEMKKTERADHIIVVLNNDKKEIERVNKEYETDVVVGGEDRAHSFQNALDHIEKMNWGCKKVVFHEAARPLIKHETIDYYFDLLDEYDYVESCKKISDSLGSYIVKAPKREDFYLIQAPEAYRFSTLKQYYDCESDVYFAANQFPDFIKGFMNFEIKNNIKITTKEDTLLVEYLLNNERHSST